MTSSPVGGSFDRAVQANFTATTKAWCLESRAWTGTSVTGKPANTNCAVQANSSACVLQLFRYLKIAANSLQGAGFT
jgi:hypothetical protein